MARNDVASNVQSRSPARKLRQTIEMYQSLEQQIQDLWASRNLEIIEEKVRALDHGKYEWTIIARRKP